MSIRIQTPQLELPILNFVMSKPIYSIFSFLLFNVLSHDKENEGEGGDCYGPLDNLEDAAEM